MRRLILILGLFAGLMMLSACGGGAADVPDTVELTVEMNDYDFVPEEIELWVGQEVTLNFVNQGAKDHEFMVGQDVNRDDGFPNGYHEEFFAVNPVIVSGSAMRDGALLMGDEEMPMEDMDMENGDTAEHDMAAMEDQADTAEHDMAAMDEHSDHLGFMVMVPLETNTATITFTVTEDMVGEWEYGCFEDDGQHYEDGMHGRLIVHDR